MARPALYGGRRVVRFNLNLASVDAMRAAIKEAPERASHECPATEILPLGSGRLTFDASRGGNMQGTIRSASIVIVTTMTFFSIELRRSGDTTEAIKGVAKRVFDRLR